MRTDQPPTVNPVEVFQSTWYRLVLLFMVPYLTVLWFVMGPSNPAYAVSVVAGTFALGPAIAGPVMRRVPRIWFRVRPSERVIHRILGVELFGRVLDLSGWNRRVAAPLRMFSGKRAGLLALEESVRAAASAHGACFAIHVALAVAALFCKDPRKGALLMLLTGVVVHLYPVLLQRSIMLRLQPLLGKASF